MKKTSIASLLSLVQQHGFAFYVKMDDEKLIELVQQYEFIYNLKHPKYMDNVKKDIVWKHIGEQLKQSAVACKQRWQCLRDAYRRALNKKKRKTGQAARNIKQWKYEKEMAFVAPFFIERKTQDSVEITSDDELSVNDDENHALEYNDLEKPTEVSDVNSIRILEDVLCNESQEKDKPKAVKRKAVESEPAALLIAKLLDQNKLDTPRGHDELDRFFLNISDTVKKLPPYKQALAKNKIFSLVSAMELQQLAATSSPSYAFNSSPQSTSSSAMPISPEYEGDRTHFFQIKKE